MILYAAADLIWASRIKGVADSLEVPARPARDLAMLEARLADCQICGMIVDLDKESVAFAIRVPRPLSVPSASSPSGRTCGETCCSRHARPAPTKCSPAARSITAST